MLEFWLKRLQLSSKGNLPPRVGVEFEFLSFDRDMKPCRIDGPEGMSSFLQSLVQSGVGTVAEEYEGLTYSVNTDFGLITLEPGCQLELSTPPRSSLTQIRLDLQAFVNAIRQTKRSSPAYLVGLGANPVNAPLIHSLLPKPRYQLMHNHFLNTGSLGPAMMRTSASTQVCIDYEDLSDLERKLELSFKLSPFLRLLFDNSPALAGSEIVSGSARARIWANTDRERSMIPESLLSGEFSLARALQAVLNMPAIFSRTNGRLVSGGSVSLSQVADFSESDQTAWLELHNSQSFFEARVKSFLEIRSPDAQLPRFSLAPPSVVHGIFDHKDSLNDCLELLRPLSLGQCQTLLENIGTHGPQTIGHLPAADFCAEIVKIAWRGIQALEGHDVAHQFMGDFAELTLVDRMSPADYTLRSLQKDYAGSYLDLVRNSNILKHY